MAAYTLIGWRAYALARGNNAPTAATDSLANAALQRAFDYIRTRYILRFATGYTENDANVTEAVYIAAQNELTTPGFWATTFTPSQVKVLTRVGEISWTPAANGMAIGVDGMLPISPAIDALLVPLTRYGMPAVMVV